MKQLKELCTFILILLLFIGCGPTIPDKVEIAYGELDEVDFNINIKPILSDRCYHCHGPDAGTRKANLRLDTRDGLFSKTASGSTPFVAGNLNKSEVIARILSNDPEIMMPPPESNRSLSTKEKAQLLQWVNNGAEWKEHWSYIPPIRSPAPDVPAEAVTFNDIDPFILNKLARAGLKQNPPAAKETLLRRVTMDLTGLPPTIEEQNEFLNDTSPDAYEKVVDRLQASTAFAERLTLEWLDVARYADSHGFHADGAREMWPWRDWVINAFQQNMPYNEFITQQLAGDLMPNATKDQVIATAFNRNHPMTAEGGAVDEEFRLEYVANRTNTLGTAFLGLTLECARCHDHKFDDISQKEYYQVSAFFNNIRELGMTGDDGDFGPMVSLSNEETDKMIAYIDEQIAVQEGKLAATSTEKTTGKLPVLNQHFNSIETKDSKRFIDGQSKKTLRGKAELIEGVNGSALSFGGQYASLYIDKFGQFNAFDPFSIGIWVRLDEETSKTKVIIGNAGEKNNLWRGWDMYLDTLNHLSFRLISSLPHNMIHVKSREVLRPGEWTHLFVSYDGSMKANGITMAMNGNTAEAHVVYDRLYKNILPTNVSRTFDDRGILIGKSNRAYTGDNGPLIGAVDELVIYDFPVPEKEIPTIIAETKEGKRPAIALPTTPEIEKSRADLYALRKERLSITDTIPELMAMEEMSPPRKTFLLARGEYDKPTEQVFPGTLSKVLPFDSTLEKNRLGLSQWLFDPRNPLTARVAVNRYWQMIFGRGIVATVNDFGSQGALPSHPKLLDYLAIEFVESGWNLRQLIKTMVMSATYRQSSRFQQANMEIDPENIYLARAPSYRHQAEIIRDNALASSGLLNPKVGGESARPYQPDSLWVELGNFSHFLLYYQQDHDKSQYRKSMYTFIRRTAPPPNMVLFDAPNREVCTVTRERTNTPLQALVLLNDPQFVEASKALAYRINQEAGQDLAAQIDYGFRLVLCRKPSREELNVFTTLYNKELAIFQEDERRASDYLSVADLVLPDGIDKTALAALTVVSNTLFNLDEAYMKR